MENLNSEQNERIRALEVKFQNLKDSFEDFKGNDFQHLNKKVNWIFLFVIAGILVPILLYIIK